MIEVGEKSQEEGSTQRLHIPFRIDIDPMEKLLLINFEKDPDPLYVGFEPQVFDDDIHGKGHSVIAWRVDGRVDVYHQPSLNLDKENYDITGKGLANIVETPMEKAEFSISQKGVEASYKFKDIKDREISLNITENNEKKRKPFGLLAPMGSVAETPSALPLVFLHDFYFVRKKHTSISISIGEKSHEPDELPVPMDFTKMLYSRYSPDPLIVAFNKETDELLPYLEIQPMLNEHSTKDSRYTIEWVSGKPRIKSIEKTSGKHIIKLKFEPSFPQIEIIEEDSTFEGEFEIEGDRSTGKIRGAYEVERREDSLTLRMTPSFGWIPKADKLSLKFLYTAVKMFKKWPSTYRWVAKIDRNGKGEFFIKSTWRRSEEERGGM